jgi:putative FmdB family regulatory protein
MPIYEYSCKKCGAHMEVMQKVSDKPLARHSKCGGKLEKEWSRTGFQFKGTGWYVTDYAGKKSDGKSEAGESKESKTDSSSAATQTDASATASGAESKSEKKSASAESKSEKRSKVEAKPAEASGSKSE